MPSGPLMLLCEGGSQPCEKGQPTAPKGHRASSERAIWPFTPAQHWCMVAVRVAAPPSADAVLPAREEQRS
jgi:hypothetical protein